MNYYKEPVGHKLRGQWMSIIIFRTKGTRVGLCLYWTGGAWGALNALLAEVTLAFTALHFDAELETAVFSWPFKSDYESCKLYCCFWPLLEAEGAICLVCSLCPQLTHCDYSLLLPLSPITKNGGYVKIAMLFTALGKKYLFVLSRLANVLWNPPRSWNGRSLWERAGQPLPSNFHQTPNLLFSLKALTVLSPL